MWYQTHDAFTDLAAALSVTPSGKRRTDAIRQPTSQARQRAALHPHLQLRKQSQWQQALCLVQLTVGVNDLTVDPTLKARGNEGHNMLVRRVSLVVIDAISH